MTPDPLSPLAAAHALLRQNRVPEAQTLLKSFVATDPASAPVRILLAVTFLRSGKPHEAEQLLRDVLSDQPNEVGAIGLLASVLKNENRFEPAIPLYRRLIDLGFGNPDVFNNLGTCYLQLKDSVSAGAAFKRAIELDRTVARSYFNLGMALQSVGNSFETYLTFRRAWELDPGFFDTYVQLWQQMRRLLNWQEGLPVLQHGLKTFPDSAQMMVMLALTYGKVGNPTAAETLYRRAAEIDPTAGPAYAHWLQEEGRFEESVPILVKSVADNPIQGQAYYNLAVAKFFRIDDVPLPDLVLPLFENAKIGNEDRMFLYYALAKYFEQEKNYELAMKNYDLANDQAYRLYNSEVGQDLEAVELEHDALVNLYSPEMISKLQMHGSNSEVPIFIVGMIRTGTTLLDQILASHHEVKSAGEQPFWQISSGRVNRRWTENGPQKSDIQELGRDYLKTLSDSTGTSPRITDKMPTNFSHIGLMSIVFPKAKFVHIRRNPMDTCLSIYCTFLGSGTQFAYCQSNIVSYYRSYLRTMDHWRTVIPPDQWIEIDYEDLVGNKELVLRGLLSRLGLEWDESCLHHEKNQSQVSTPSLWAVRQPVNSASVERWKRYEPWMGEFRALKDLRHPEPENPVY